MTADNPHISLLDAAILSLPPCEIDYLTEYKCPEPATVFHRQAELHACARHFNLIEREYEI